MEEIIKKDKWRLYDNDITSQNYGQSFPFDFEEFIDELKYILKEYIWTKYTSGDRRVKGLKEFYSQIKFFNEFCIKYGIEDLNSLSVEDMDNYRTFLRWYISSFTGKALSYSTQRGLFGAVKSIIGWSQSFLPDKVPAYNIFIGNEYKANYNEPAIEFIPDDIMVEIHSALEQEQNCLLKNGIIILEHTGMRLGDLLLLTIDCIKEHPVSGYTISWYDHKNKKQMNALPIPVKCVKAVNEIIAETKSIRMEAREKDRNKLFLYKPKTGHNEVPVIRVANQVFTKWIGSFCKNHDIRDSGGNIFRLTTHMFRRTLATDMLSKGANINVIQGVMGHSDPATTKKYYADYKDVDREKTFKQIGILGSISQIGESSFDSEEEKAWFAENCNGKARLKDGYCTLPIKEGKPCGRFLSQQKCYLCNRFVTTLDDLDNHRKHLQELEELLQNNIYGEHFAMHIIPSVIALREIVKQLEEIENEHKAAN